jgi:hypothetical protein
MQGIAIQRIGGLSLQRQGTDQDSTNGAHPTRAR